MSHYRKSYLLNLIRTYKMPKFAIHNLVYYHTFMLKLSTGYKFCDWKPTIWGMYCSMIERDLDDLIRSGFIKIANDGTLYDPLWRGKREKLDVNDLVSKCVNHFLMKETLKITA